MKINRNLITTVLMFLVMSLLGCNKSDTQFTPATQQAVSCTVNSTASGQIAPISALNWTLQPGNQSEIAVSLNTAELGKFSLNDSSCQLTYQIALVYVSNTMIDYMNSDSLTSLSYMRTWENIPSSGSSFLYQNVLLARDTKFNVCIRVVTDNGESSSAHCKGFRVPDFNPPLAVKCNPFELIEITIGGSQNPIVNVNCNNISTPYVYSTAYADSNNVLISPWVNFVVSRPAFAGGQNYKILTKAVNRDGYESSISEVSFYMPLQVNLKLNFLSRQGSTPSLPLPIHTCQISIKTFDNYVTEITKYYPSCTVTQPSAANYEIDCSSTYQTCSVYGCTAIPYVNTTYDFCDTNWLLPFNMQKSFNYY